MNTEIDLQKIMKLVLKKWKLVAIFCLIGALLIGIYSANFATKTYSSSVKFFVYAVETQQELSDSTLARNATSNTSKMNYAMQMMETYTEMLNTSEFAKRVANDLNKKYNSNYTYKDISKCISIETKEDTAIMTMTVTTDDKATAFQIARQLEITVPKVMKNKNNGLLNASVEDAAIEASTPNGMGTVKKSILGFIAGGVIAVAYIIFRDLLDVRVKTSEELTTRYNIPVLGTIPEFEIDGKKAKKKNDKEENE